MKDVQKALPPSLDRRFAFPGGPLLSGRVQSEHPPMIERHDPSLEDVHGTLNLLGDSLEGEIAVFEDGDSLLP